MKKILLSFMVSCSGIMFSQMYHFDYYLKYNLKNSTSQKTTVKECVVNSKEHQYHLVLYKESEKNTLAQIIDFKNNYFHFFEVSNEVFPLKPENFVYLYSKKVPSIKESNKSEWDKRIFSSEVINTSDFADYLQIKEFQDKNSSKPVHLAEVEMERKDFDLSFMGLRILFDSNFIDEKLNLPNAYLLQSGSINSENSSKSIYLEKSEMLEFSLTVSPKQIKLK